LDLSLFFGMAGSHNDINVLRRSLVLSRLADGDAPVYNYEINGHPYNKSYYLADGICPDWSTFVKTICEPAEEKNRRFAKRREACRKDVERAFGVIQSRWAIVRHPMRTWSTEVMCSGGASTKSSTCQFSKYSKEWASFAHKMSLFLPLGRIGC
jgi:hypothetical protein